MNLSQDTIQKVWDKGTAVPPNDAAIWRMDQRQAWMRRGDYGNRDSEYRWEIDHITPQSQGASDQLSNLRPLQWQNNANKENGGLGCALGATDGHNVAAR